MNNTLFFGLIGGLLLVGPRLLPTTTFGESPKKVSSTQRVAHDDKPLRRVEKTTAEWKKILTSDQFAVTRQEGTERPFTSPLVDVHEHGEFRCVNCHEPLFPSETKFESGTGWPSFYAPVSKRVVKEIRDNQYGMVRTEVQCAVCDAHLGHVFTDGPRPTGLRYCMNGVALEFVKK
jgi:peptide-methionine (R)-S-oxide reductase